MCEESGLELLGAQRLPCELASECCSQLSALQVGGVEGEDTERVRVRGARGSLRFSVLGMPAQRQPFSPRRVAPQVRRKPPGAGQAPERSDPGWNFVLSVTLCWCPVVVHSGGVGGLSGCIADIYFWGLPKGPLLFPDIPTAVVMWPDILPFEFCAFGLSISSSGSSFPLHVLLTGVMLGSLTTVYQTFWQDQGSTEP